MKKSIHSFQTEHAWMNKANEVNEANEALTCMYVCVCADCDKNRFIFPSETLSMITQNCWGIACVI